jgi:hypothetical protein
MNLSRNAIDSVKSDGMSLGQCIRHSIVGARGWHMWASPGPHHGPVFSVVVRSGKQ